MKKVLLSALMLFVLSAHSAEKIESAILATEPVIENGQEADSKGVVADHHLARITPAKSASNNHQVASGATSGQRTSTAMAWGVGLGTSAVLAAIITTAVCLASNHSASPIAQAHSH